MPQHYRGRNGLGTDLAMLVGVLVFLLAANGLVAIFYGY
jgi:hypothetical protein